MQKLLSVVLLILLIIATLTGCQTKSPEVSVKNTIDTGVQTYCERPANKSQVEISDF